MKTIGNVILALMLIATVYAAEDVVSAVHGVITKIDSGTKTIVVKTTDGTEHSLHFAAKTTVHGADASARRFLAWIEGRNRGRGSLHHAWG